MEFTAALNSPLDEIVRAASRASKARQGRGAVVARDAPRTAVARGRGSRPGGRGGMGAASSRVAHSGVVKKQARKSSVVVVGRSGPARSQAGRSDTRSQMLPEAPAECKIGETTDVKAAAGFLSSMIRARTPVPVLSMTEISAFVAINALALAHQYLAETTSTCVARCASFAVPSAPTRRS
jgi:hypothetical protein